MLMYIYVCIPSSYVNIVGVYKCVRALGISYYFDLYFC